MNLEILKWRGRLGNNIIQLKNIIGIALYYNYNIILPYHKYFNKKYIIINKSISILNNKIQDSTDFFTLNTIKIHNKDIDYHNIFNKETKKKIKKIITPLFKYDSSELSELPENILLIHIRGGDIFSNNPNPNYIVPPLSYYINIIEKNKNRYRYIYLLSEDDKNPCIEALINLYSNIRYKKRSFELDIKLILRAKNIIISYGTFVPSLLNLSDYIENVYYPSYLVFNKFLIKDVKFHKVNLDDYRKKINKWVNNTNQNDIIINYGINKKQIQN